MSKQRILVTGATGFVGRHFVSHVLSTSDRTITIAVRDNKLCPLVWREHDRLRIVETGAIQTANNLDAALADVSDVIHLAGLAHAPRGAGEGAFFAANANATEKITKAAAAHGIRAFVHLSSLAAVTRNASPTPINDMTDDPDETPYGRSKHDAEKHVATLASQGILAVSLRPPLVVGHDAKGNWAALQKLASSGLPLPFGSAVNKRSLIGIHSLVYAMRQLASGTWSAEKSGNYCIADEAMSLIEIISTLRAGMELPQRLFRFPTEVLTAVAGLAGRKRLASGLLGNLAVDASGFRSTFDVLPAQSLTEAIRESGRLYLENTKVLRRAQ